MFTGPRRRWRNSNRVLGGGVVPGVLIGGRSRDWEIDPASPSADPVVSSRKRFSMSVERSRPSRSNSVQSDWRSISEFYLYAETNVQSVRAEVERIQSDFLIIDSIQTIMSPEISGVQGSVSQVREVTAELMQLAKTNNIAIFIVGHVTREGTLAGPRMLEHMVDTVLYFEGGTPPHLPILRAVKNRFGSTNEIGIFEMQSGGLG